MLSLAIIASLFKLSVAGIFIQYAVVVDNISASWLDGTSLHGEGGWLAERSGEQQSGEGGCRPT